MRTEVVRADFQRLITPHHQPDFLSLLVLQQPHLASASFFPLLRGVLEPEELGAPA